MPPRSVPSLSTDQLAAFVETARQGSLRAAAGALFITEQGVRNRLVTLEKTLGVQLYRKLRGPRSGDLLTSAGRKLLPLAHRLLDEMGGLVETARTSPRREVHIAASQYLSTYVLIDAIRRFHRVVPQVRVWLSVRTERDIEQALLSNADLDFGVAAPYELSPQLTYQNLFSMSWSVVTPPGHQLAKKSSLRLADLQDQPLILFERGSTGRQHIMDAFLSAGVTPRVEMEATTTDLVLRMVMAGLGVAIIPVLPKGVVTRGQSVSVRRLTDPVRPIDSGLLTRTGEPLTDASRQFAEFIRQEIVRRKLVTT